MSVQVDGPMENGRIYGNCCWQTNCSCPQFGTANGVSRNQLITYKNCLSILDLLERHLTVGGVWMGQVPFCYFVTGIRRR